VEQETEVQMREVGKMLNRNAPVAQQSLLPSAKDPRIFMVKCTQNKEMELVKSVMHKSLVVFEKTKQLKVISAFCGGAKGYIYIEAISDTLAKELLQGLKGVYTNRIRQVAVAEMTTVLTLKVNKKPLKIGQFVRIKRGLLKGDLVRIMNLTDGDTVAHIQAVPRIDYSETAAVNADDNNSTTAAATPASQRVKFNLGSKQRPPQAFFDVERAFANSDVDRDSRFGFYEWRGERYQNGFLIREFNVNTFIDAENVNAKVEELKLFNRKLPSTAAANTQREDEDETDDNDELKSETTTPSMKGLNAQLNSMIRSLEEVPVIPFVPGDNVRVIRGEVAGLIGRIVAVNESAKILRLQPQSSSGLTGLIEVEMKLVAKHIEQGAHVKVMGGRYAGQTGRVVGLSTAEEDPTAVILTDGLNTEISCNLTLLQMSAEIATGHGDLQGFELYDLVQLNENEFGVIINVGVEALRVLTHQEISKDVYPQEIRSKLNLASQRAKSFDAEQKQFGSGDTLKVISGGHDKLTGTVKHLHKGTVWLHSTSYLKHSGVFVVKARNCLLSGQQQQRGGGGGVAGSMTGGVPITGRGGGYGAVNIMSAAANSRPSSQGSGQSPASNFSSRNNQIGGNRARGGRDPLIGTTVRITKGAYKGLLAQVADGDGVFYNMELLAKLKKVVINRENFVSVGDRNGPTASQEQAAANGPSYYGNDMMTPGTPYLLHGAQTPTHLLGSETPRWAGGETPLHGSMTPYNRAEDSNDGAWRTTEMDLQQHLQSAPVAAGDNYGSTSLTTDASPFQVSGMGTPYTPQSQYTLGSGLYNPSLSSMVGSMPPTPQSSNIGSDWPVGTVVGIKAGVYIGRLAVLMQQPITDSNQCMINLRDGMGKLIDNEFPIAMSAVAPAEPVVGAVVQVISGKFKNQRGIIKSKAGKESIVKMDSGIEMIRSTALCWINVQTSH
jgi:transcription elongation factor SPT5